MARVSSHAHLRQEALRRYAAGEFLTDLRRELGVPFSTMARWAKIAGIHRTASQSKAMAVARKPGGARHLGRKAAFRGSKLGIIIAESSYEFARLGQLEVDPDVVSVERCSDVIPYVFMGKARSYNPDFSVRLTGDRRRIEEVKPAKFCVEPSTAAKLAAGAAHYGDLIGVAYAVVTEAEIGAAAITAALAVISDLDEPEVKAARMERRRLQRRRAQATLRRKFNANATPEQKSAQRAYLTAKAREYRARDRALGIKRS